jgi:hypothetical protein
VPAWGAELSAETIPLEAGLETRAISTSKGCYTGQEVIIRILHRGHVNRVLRGLLLGAAAGSPGLALVRADTGKPVGAVTSCAWSPLVGEQVALGYVRREVSPGEVLRIDSVDGPPARVVELPFA